MATARFSVATKNAILDAIKTAIDSGGAAGTIKIYTGTMPADPSVAPGGTLLGTLTFSYPCSAGASAGELDMSPITGDTLADDSGTAAWARCSNSAGSAKLDIDVTSTAGTGALKLNTVVIAANGPINVNSFKITLA